MDAPPAPRAPADGTRTRIVRAAAVLMQRQGYEATGIKRIAQDAGATLGSVYHFFPGGKKELAVEALRHGAQEFTDLLRTGLDSSDDPAEAVAECARLLARTLRDSDWTDGCPVAATALEFIGRSPAIQLASEEALGRWRELLAGKLGAAGISDEVARELACSVLSTLEGAELLCRVSASEEPLHIAGRHLARLIRSF
ncbi:MULTISPECIES: TetR/AcrR family transcriptional regulator [Actinomadura]|uniref:TetR family transcriptional regulator n=1 Tax=Actinomadura litoris TaxID=2678616 RepID=A0A7K1L1V2_9ACTN|nr:MULTISPECIES: TetR/AcrR family transcriptional regulator [Actinomadura]MBT2206519.1 TetR/AcrR family transcriptional regulator [Actinomadura sp. NEAU-AAG7]MUN38381.1 TetR family transcriptional regulator [Actinomadura litoris]